MSRRSRAGTAEKPPSVEETLGRLEVKLKEMELKYELKEKAESQYRTSLEETIESLRADLEKVFCHQKETRTLIERNESQSMKESKRNGIIEHQVSYIDEKLTHIVGELERVQEKMYDFELNKKNNLIFYGIPNEINEKEPQLICKIKELIKSHMKIRREILITTATRLYTGPDVLGSRPCLVTFEEFRDREEILKNSKLLKKPTISVTEDLSKRTRIARQELRKFMRHVKRVNPEKRCLLQYDKLYIDGKLFGYSESSGKVEQQFQNGLDKVQSDDSESLSSVSSRMGMKSFSTTSLVAEIEKEDKIRELENMLDDQRIIIDNQNRKISELEMARETEFSRNNFTNGMNNNDAIEQSEDHYKNGHDEENEDEIY